MEDMKNEEMAELLAGAYQRQYHHNTYPELSNNSEFTTSKEEIKEACMQLADYKDRQCYFTLLRVFDLIANKRDAGEALQYIKETLEFIIKDHYGDVDKDKTNKMMMKSYCNLMCIGNSENCISLAPCKEYSNIIHIYLDWLDGRNKDYQPKGDYTIRDMIAWLEKQGEKIHANSAKTCKDEQKPADKVEPKFHEGDWVVSNPELCFESPLCIKDIDNNNYRVESVDGCSGVPTINYLDNYYHLWTIQDAKDGDVLSFYFEYKGNKMEQTGIIEKYVGKHGGCSNTFKVYAGVNWENNFQIGEYMGCSDIHPATKEERDILFKAIHRAGYEWDADKKELKNFI